MYNMRVACLLVVLLAWAFLASAEVIELNNANFEKLTQAATGATTGDWLVKFYAPWCGHCKTMAPTFDKVAEELEGVVNVARVDVMKNRDLGTRFEIKGFPTVKMISKGNVYSFSGKRDFQTLVDFATGGFAISNPEPVPGELGWFGEIMYVYRHAYKEAAKNLQKGNYFTMDVFLVALPIIFVVIMFAIWLIPVPDPARRSRMRPRPVPSTPGSVPNLGTSRVAAPPTASVDSRTKSD
jgi:protein disulfide-isomerase-like protein